jgi:hypothetical protein
MRSGIVAWALLVLSCGVSRNLPSDGGQQDEGGQAGSLGGAGKSDAGATGGTDSAAGRGGGGGAAGAGGVAATGGSAGTGGRAGTAGTGGAAETVGAGGAAGAAGSGGAAGTGAAGAASTGGVAGAAGTGGAAGTAGEGAVAGTGGAAGVGCPGCPIAILPVAGADLVYSAIRNRLYVTVAGDATMFANTIVEVDPTTSSVVSAIPVGSNPGPLAISDDGSTLWVGIGGSFSFRKVTLTSAAPVVGPLNALPMTGSRYFAAQSIAALPGVPSSVAMLISDGIGTSEVHVYDDGVSRVTSVKNATTAAFLARGPTGLLFGARNDTKDFFVFTVSAAGVTQSPFYNLFEGNVADLDYAGGRAYLGSAEVLDVSNPAAPVGAGSFTFNNAGSVLVSDVALRDAQTALILTQDPFTNPQMPTGALRIFSTAAMTETTSLPLPAPTAFGMPRYWKLVYAGGDAAAFLKTEDPGGIQVTRLMIMHDPAIGPSGGGTAGAGGAGGSGGAAGTAGIGGTGGAVVGGGTAGSGGAGGTGGDPCPGCSFATVPAYGRHLAYDASHKLIYLTADAEATMNANSVVTVDPSTATVSSVVPVGADPQPLALADDNSLLWIGLVGDRAVQKLTTGATPVAGVLHQLPILTTNETALPESIAVLPGTPSSIAVSARGAMFGGISVFILDEGAPRANFGPPAVDVSFLTNGPPGYLFGIGIGDSLITLRLGSAGLVLASHSGLVVTNNETSLSYSGTNLYASMGEVVDVTNPDAPRPAGRFPFAPCVMAMRRVDRVMLLCGIADPSGGLAMRIFDTATFAPVGIVTLPQSLDGALWVDFAYVAGDAAALLALDMPLTIMHSPLIGNPQ